MCLVDSGAAVTAIANDFGYVDVFRRQLMCRARSGDVLIGISVSGQSENVVAATTWARDNGLETLALTGTDGGRLHGAAHVGVGSQGPKL